MPTRVLMVCLGNICRSPTAEAVLRQRARERGLGDDLDVDSAGTGDWHVGRPRDERSCAAAARRGFELTGTARQVSPRDFATYDLIVAMDEENLRDLRRIAPPGTEHKIRKLADVDVPDPYYGGADGFDRVIDIVVAGCDRLLDEIAGAVAS